MEHQWRIAARPMNGGMSHGVWNNPNVYTELERKDALLAEVAEVLREFPERSILDVKISLWWIDQAKPLLDKLEQR